MNKSSKKKTKTIKNFFKIFQKLNKLELIILILYFVLICFITFHHELDQDEIQSFLIARDLNYFEMIKQTIYEGHSFFWSFLISPFAKLGFSVESQKIIPLLFATVTAYTILRKAPFKLYLKILLIFSSGMIYYYSSIARPYCVIIFLLVMIASIYEKRKDHPYLYCSLIGLLANTHAIMLPTVCFLILYFYYDIYIKKNKLEITSKQRKICITITTILLAIPFFIYFLGYFFCEINNEPSILDCIKNLKVSYPSNYNYIMRNYFGVTPQNLFIFTFFSISCVTIHFFLLIALKKNLKYGIIFWCQYQFVILVHATIWFPITTRIHLFPYFLMFWFWMSHYEKQIPKKNIKILEISLAILIIIVIPNTCRIIYSDILYRNSDGEEAAEFIKKSIPKNSVIINVNTDYSQLIAGYLNKEDYKFYMPNQERFITFNIWDNKYVTPLSLHQIEDAIEELEKDYKNIYILAPNTNRVRCFNINLLKNHIKLEKIYETDVTTMIDKNNVYDLVYFEIYKIIN